MMGDMCYICIFETYINGLSENRLTSGKNHMFGKERIPYSRVS